MKQLFFIAALFISTVGFAQSAQEEIDLMQSLYGMQKKEIVAEFIKLEGPQKDAFWEIYDAYEVERKVLGQRRLNLLATYAEFYSSLNDDATDILIKEMNDITITNDKLISKYYGKLKKPAGVKAAAQFVQIESYLLSDMRATILEEIPFIGELD
jgi:hypothetical protein